MELRGYQGAQERRIRSAWNEGARNVVAVSPTGSGKTVLFSKILHEHTGAACAIAHRQELVSQISVSLAHEGVSHSIIGPRNVVKFITQLHREETGRVFYDPNAPIAVAGVDTLVKRGGKLARWCEQVTLWVQDEAHHLLASNKWGTAAAMFPNAYGLGVTATPCRADGKGLGRHADGVFDRIIPGPTMRDLITDGYLADYTILCPASDIDLSTVETSGATGDFNREQLRRAAKKSHLVGDVVEHYVRHAAGKRGITFATDVESATEMAAKYLGAGVPAAVLSAKTPDRERHALMKRFRSGDLLQLVNVDICGEGVDIPSIEVVSFARPTQSYTLYVQQFGRALRVFEGKERALILDHVDNVRRHNGPPDVPREWSLDRRPSARRGKRDPDVIPMKICAECTQPYEAVHSACPHCGTAYVPAGRSLPAQVDGDLVELDAAAIAALRGDIERIDENPANMRARLVRSHMPGVAVAGAVKQHTRRQEAQVSLRNMLELFGARQARRGRSQSEAHRRFFFRYGVDVMSAQALGRADAERLAVQLIDDIGRGKA